MLTRFEVRAEAEPAALVRLLDLFAQRSMMPISVSAHVLEGELQVVITLRDVAAATARNLCARMDNMIGVRAACVSPAPHVSGSITPPSTRSAASIDLEVSAPPRLPRRQRQTA